MAKHKVFRLSPNPQFLPFKPVTTYVGTDENIRKLEEFIFETRDEITPRLTVDLVRQSITLDAKTYQVTSDNALRWVRVLADHPGEWFSSEQLKPIDTELMNPRPDKWRKHLPEEVLKLIESMTGKGSRIKL
jgi:hypothetical protein